MSRPDAILVVDDEKNIRTTMQHALDAGDIEVHAVGTGEEALQVLASHPRIRLVFLDLKLPGIGGVEVLRHVRKHWPDVAIVVITAHGTVESAVEAMRLGATDFIRKPFTPDDIRVLASSVLAPVPDDTSGAGYDDSMAEATLALRAHQPRVAVAHIRRAIGVDPSRPEAFNLLGAAAHMSGQPFKAQDYFRAALALSPTYKPAWENLDRSVSGGVREPHMALSLGAEDDGGRHE